MKRFFALLFTVFIDSLGFGLVFPIFSPLIIEGDAILGTNVSLAARGLIFGILIACFCIGQFFGGPMLGAISDRKGRRKVLLITLWIAFFSYLASAASIACSSIVGLFLSRIFSGTAAGNFAVAQSAVADGSLEEEKSKNFALLGMAWGVGFIIGPYIGGKLSDPHTASWCGWTTPFLFAAFLCLVNVMLLTFNFKETLTTFSYRKVNVLEGFAHIKKAFLHPTLRYLFLIMFIFSFGWGFFTEFSGVFLIGRFGFEQSRIGNFYACIGIWVAICQGILIRPFLKRFSSHVLLLTGFFCLAWILPLLLVVEEASSMYFILPFLIFAEALIYPTASALVSDLSSKDTQGEMLGIHNSVQWAAIGISPLFSGSFVALYPHLPITVSSLLMLIGFFVFLWIVKQKKIPISAKK